MGSIVIIVFVLIQQIWAANSNLGLEPVHQPEATPCGGEENHAYLETCVMRTTDFLREYVKRLAKERPYDTCSRFFEMRECIECARIGGYLHSDWFPVIEQLACTCEGNGACRADLDCFEMEYQGLLIKRCDDVFKFDVKQKTKGRCFFVQNSINCKGALVTSRCGQRAGKFAYHINSIIANSQYKNKQCALSKPTSYLENFVYDPNCPKIFIHDMATCSYRHLRGEHQHLLFHKDNDLVTTGDRSDVKDACSSFRNYKLCMRPIKKACRAGTDLVYSYDETLRKYVIKMDYICQKQRKSVYANSLTCYKEILHNGTLDECGHIWKTLAPWLERVTAHEFYCQKHSAQAGKLREELEHLRSCYENVFRRKCGADGGEMMGELINIAFEDPHYLRFRYRPDCDLHSDKPKSKRRLPDKPHTPATSFIPQTDNHTSLNHVLSSTDRAHSAAATSKYSSFSTIIFYMIFIICTWTAWLT